MADPKKYAANLELYEKLVATNPKVQRKGATMPYTSVNGHMSSLFTKDVTWHCVFHPMCNKRF